MSFVPGQYVVVARAPAAARLMPEDRYSIDYAMPDRSLRITIRTLWEDTGLAHPLPRWLWFDVRGEASSIEEAVGAFSSAARTFGPLLAFVANAEVGMVEPELAYDDTPGIEDHEHFQVFLPGRGSILSQGRAIDLELLGVFLGALQANPDSDRITRAIGQYEMALRSWFLGGESIAIGHLFIAAENLKRVAVRVHCTRNGVSEKDLARSLDIDPDDPDRPRWKSLLDEWSRLEIIFGGDVDTHREAKKASDGLEHGFMDFSEIHRRSRACADKTFAHIRRSVLDLLNIEAVYKERLLDLAPLDTRSTRRIARGKFVGTGDLAAPDKQYPILEWTTTATGSSRTDRSLTVAFGDRLRPIAAPGVHYRGRVLEVHGRSVDGEPPIQYRDVTPPIEPTSQTSISAARVDSADYLQKVCTRLDQEIPVAAKGEAADLKLDGPIDELVLRTLWRARSLLQASIPVIRDGWGEEAVAIAEHLWWVSVLLGRLANADHERRVLVYLDWYREAIESQIDALEQLDLIEPSDDHKAAIDTLRAELDAAPARLSAQYGVAVRSLPPAGERELVAESQRLQDYPDFLLLGSLARGGLSGNLRVQRADRADGATELGTYPKSLDPSIITGTSKLLASSYIACVESALRLREMSGSDLSDLLKEGELLAEADYRTEAPASPETPNQ